MEIRLNICTIGSWIGSCAINTRTARKSPFLDRPNFDNEDQEATPVKIRTDQVLRFWVDCEHDLIKHECVGGNKSQQIPGILQEYEKAGDAMRYLNANGQVAWKATPAMLSRLADAEREADADFED
jgi:hypothetical protein